MMVHRSAALALLLGALLAAGAPEPPLSSGETFVSAEVPSNSSVQAVFAEGAVLGGQLLAIVAGVDDEAACSTACRNNDDCSWFNWCGSKGGCLEANGGAGLAYQDCELLSSNCTIAPPVLARGTEAVAGFPLRYRLPALPDVVGRPGQGVQGADFECEGTVVPGKCAFAGPVSELLATMACTQTFAQQCRSAVVYTGGLDGCSSKLVLLKSADLVPSNSFAAPTVFTMERVEGASTGGFIFRSEASLVGAVDDSAGPPPACSPNTTAANGTAAGAANSSADCSTPQTAWLGCLVSNVPAVMAGDVVATLDDVASAEACCRACRKRSPAANVFNYCSRVEGCSFKDLSTAVTLRQGQCELRYQRTVDPSTSTPPVLLGKGDEAGGFTAGTPLAAYASVTPGFTRFTGGGLFGQPTAPCANSSISNLQECGVQGTLEQVAARCTADPECAAIIFKPGGLGDASINSSLGLLRRASGANATLMVVNPSTLVYFKDTASSSGSSGLSAGAIAGVAAGCAVLAVAAAAGGWVALRRRRQRRMQHSKLPKAVEEAGAPRPAVGAPPPAPSSAPAASSPQLLSVSVPASQNGASFGAAQQHSSPLPAQDVAHFKLRPVAAASPFTSMRQSRMTGSTGTAGSACTPRSPVRPAPGVSDPELHLMMSELMQFRAREDAATDLSSPSSLGRAQEAVGSRSPSGGAPSSGGQLSSGDLNTGGTSLSGGSGPLPSGRLPSNLEAWLIPAAAIQIDRGPTGEVVVLGEGASGRVVKAEFRGEPVAVKEVQVGRGVQVLEAFLLEAQRMQQLRHANIVSFFGMAVDNAKGLLVMELCEGRDLGSALKLRDASGSRLFGWHRHGCRIACEVATAINYLHSQTPAVVHMDIKSTNVLLGASGNAKLSDVGVSRTQTKTYLSLAAPVGTFAWVAPEVLMGGRCGRAVDIYSFGVLLWEIITGEQPVRGNLRMPHVPEEASQEAAELMEQCTRLDPSERPSAQEVMKRLQAMLAAQRSAARRAPVL